jgi:dTDP-4-dehydrorhamnose 3,5-epimerase-like enzyme
LEGECLFLWQDLRQDSPTHDVIQREKAATPTLVLAPFGVAFGIHALSESRLLRIAAQDESEVDSGEILPWPEK